jgi:hypothetical protein
MGVVITFAWMLSLTSHCRHSRTRKDDATQPSSIPPLISMLDLDGMRRASRTSMTIDEMKMPST